MDVFTENPKYFYSYASKYSQTKNSIGPFLGRNNEEISNSSIKFADMLQQQYKTASRIPDKHNYIHNPNEFFTN